MFDAEKFFKEFDNADAYTYTIIKGLCLKLSSAENDIDRTVIMGHLFDMVDLAETEYKAARDQGKHWRERYFTEYKKGMNLEQKLEEIQKAAST